MAIRRRITTQETPVKQPDPQLPGMIAKLFEVAIPFGTVLTRTELFCKHLPFFEKYKIVHDGLALSLRPTWTKYYGSPGHVLINGHIIICHAVMDEWYRQPTARLFAEDVQSRMKGLEHLLQVGKRYEGQKKYVS